MNRLRSEDTQNTTRTLQKGLQVLTAVAETAGSDGVTLAELSRRLKVNKSTLYRLLNTLEGVGYVERDAESDRYRPGMMVLYVSSFLLEHLDLREQARPFLKVLMQAVNETAYLTVLDGAELVYLDRVTPSQVIYSMSKVGKRQLAHPTASGKAMIAYLPAEQVDAILEKGMVARTSKTVTDKALFRSVLETVRQQGYAVDLNEAEEDVRCVAAPIFNHRNRVVAAVSVSGLDSHFTETTIPEFAQSVRECALGISRRIGYRG